MSFVRQTLNHLRYTVGCPRQQLQLLKSVPKVCLARNSSTAIANEMNFPGAQAPFVSKPSLTMPSDVAPIPIYRVMDRDGKIADATQDPQLDKEVVQKMFRDMVQLNTMEKIMFESQRQGRISYFLASYGEEATHIGSAAALELRDWVYAQYREAGVLVWRGFTIEEFIDQCFGNENDAGRGKQMPVHYGSKELNFVTISSTLATQMPQAVGAAYAFKLREGNDTCVVCYYGEGGASEGDALVAFNFAATLDCPVILFCRNNGFAFSTPTYEQYKGDGIAGRGPGFGIASIRVDGTDVFAVYNATKLAREYALKYNKPVVLEAMGYRVGHHSTSDDSTTYRSSEENEFWNTVEQPISKLKKYMLQKGWFDEEDENAFVKDVHRQVVKQISISEKKLKPNWKEMFDGVYDVMPTHLKEQMRELEQHIEAHSDYYPLKSHKQ